jgi:hypothetical protein
MTQLRMYLEPAEVKALAEGKEVNLGECALLHRQCCVEIIIVPRLDGNNLSKNATPCQRSSATEPLVISSASTVKRTSDAKSEGKQE